MQNYSLNTVSDKTYSYSYVENKDVLAIAMKT